MAMAVFGHGAVNTGQAEVLSSRCYCGERASSLGSAGGLVSGRAAAMIGRRSAGFGCPLAEAAVASSPCRTQRMNLITSSSSDRSSNSRISRHTALRSRQTDVAVGGEAEAVAEEEPMASFWERLQEAWRVLIGAPTGAQATKKRVSRLLARDRGFHAANLSRLYRAAKGAIKEHVELEVDEDSEVAAVVDKLGVLRLDFRVKRVKSLVRDEPFAELDGPDLDPSLSMSGDQLWGYSMASRDSKFRLAGAYAEQVPDSVIPDVEPSLSISGEQQLWDYDRTPVDLKARLGMDFGWPPQNNAVPGVEASQSMSRDHLWEDSRAAQDTEVYGRGASSRSEAHSSEPSLRVSLPNVEPSLSLNERQSWEENRASQDDERVLHLKPAKVGRAETGHVPKSVAPRMERSRPISGDQLWKNRSSQTVDVRARGASKLMSTTDGDNEEIWYTFSFTDADGE